jgi:formate-dependent nitrite reductase membrane component NrfD
MLSEQMRPYEFMVHPTLQTAWIRGKGILLFSGLFLVEFGAGIFLAASLLQSLWGQAAGWFISGAMGGGCHFLFLGRPFRVYRALRRPESSWISRGLIIIALFQLFGLLHLISVFLSAPTAWITVVANILATATILYGGYEIADVRSIRAWNSAFIPIQMLARSFFIGSAVVLVVNLLLGLNVIGIDMKQWLVVILFINIGLLVLSLVSTGFEEGREKLSLSMMATGSLKWIFWPWVIAGGMMTPLILLLYALASGFRESSINIYIAAMVLEVLGDLLLRYCFMRSGYYSGLFPGRPSDFR